MSNFWVQQGKTVQIICLESGVSAYALNNQVGVVDLGKSRFFKNNIPGSGAVVNLVKVFQIRNIFKKNRQTTFISFIDRTNILSLLAKLLLNTRLVISDRSNLSEVYIPLIWKVFRKKLYRYADLMVVQTSGVLKEYEKLHIKLPLVRVIPNPVSVGSTSLDHNKKEQMLLAVGRLHKEKGFDTLIKAYKKAEINWPLYIVGEGEERINLTHLIDDLNLVNQIFLVGYTNDVEHYYSRASIFVLSSLAEGMPNVLLEAMSHGCACISTDCAYGPAEIIDHNLNGILVENNRIDLLAEALKRLVHHPSKIQSLGIEAQKKAKEFNIENVSVMWDNAISSNW